MTKFLNNTTQTIAWLKKAHDDGDLEMKPPFQRNPVWTRPQKSFLIDSVLNGYPVPEIYMQQYVDDKGKERHVIIDGQQRVRACLEFIQGEFSMVADESPTWGDMRFDDLTAEDKKKLFGYRFVVRQLPEMPDAEIRAIFQRLNKNVVALNAQELRQATYWGPFLKTMQELSDYSYWSTTGIFTPTNIRRMQDVEFITELAVATLFGHQNKKESLDDFYLRYEIEFDQQGELVDIFKRVILELELMYPDIKATRWRKKSDFYSLFVTLATAAKALPMTAEQRTQAREHLDHFSAKVDAATRGGLESDLTPEERSYFRALPAGSDVNNRKKRHESLSVILEPILNESNSKGAKGVPAAIKDLFDGGADDV